MKKILFLLVAAAFVIGSCHKGEEKQINKRFEIIRNHKWKLVSQTINGVDQPISDCESGNYWVFKADEYGYEANVTCGDTQVVVVDSTNNNGTDTTKGAGTAHKASATPTQIDFTWSITGDQRYCYIKDFGVPGNNIDWFFVYMDDTKFDVTGNYEVNGTDYAYHKYFVAE
jgi:hypothetical protein